VVGVDVDEAGRDDRAVGVDGLARVLVDVADRDNPSRAHTDVRALLGCAGAVDDLSTADHQIEHATPPSSDALSGYRSAGSGRLVGGRTWATSRSPDRRAAWVARSASGSRPPGTP